MADQIVAARQVVTCAGAVPRRGPQGPGQLGVIDHGAVAILEGRVLAVGPRTILEAEWTCPEAGFVDFPGTLLPGLVDAHTHPVYAGSRVPEFRLRAQGATYQQIHAAGGGIHATVAATRSAADAALEEQTVAVFKRMQSHGTAAAEVKSGYGLTADQELRLLAILARAAAAAGLECRLTLLAAHAVPGEWAADRAGYLAHLLENLLPRAAAQGLASQVDVYCEDGAFTPQEARTILRAAKALGFGLRLHADQFSDQGGACLAADLGATAVDHLEAMNPAAIPALAAAGTVAILLPAVNLFLDLPRRPPARELIAAGVPVALGTDFNAGSCLSESLPFAMGLACLQYKMTPEEAILAATVNSASCLGLADAFGSIEAGKAAHLIGIALPDYQEWLYHLGTNLVIARTHKGAFEYDGRLGDRPLL